MNLIPQCNDITGILPNTSMTQSDLEPIHVGGSAIESMTSFRYLGSVVECRGSVNAELTARVLRAATVFGAMRRSVFSDKLMCLQTKRMVYQAVVLGVLLYAVETWPIKQSNLHPLEVFHYHCLRNILGISKSQQIAQHISNEEVRHRMGLLSPLSDIISSRRPCWLGHLARMGDHQLPKQILFGWLPQPRPPHGPRLRWRDRIRKYLKLFHIDEGGWYVVAQNRDEWRQLRATSPLISSRTSAATKILL